jgi:hypothetical protein
MVDPNYGSWSVGALEYWSVEEGLEYMDFCVFGISITPALHYSTTTGSSFPLPAVLRPAPNLDLPNEIFSL